MGIGAVGLVFGLDNLGEVIGREAQSDEFDRKKPSTLANSLSDSAPPSRAGSSSLPADGNESRASSFRVEERPGQIAEGRLSERFAAEADSDAVGDPFEAQLRPTRSSVGGRGSEMGRASGFGASRRGNLRLGGGGRGGRDDDDYELQENKDFEHELKIQQLTQGLTEAPVDQRDQIAMELRQELSDLFDVRTTVRETQIKQLEERIRILREQLNKRVDVKDEIIQLRLQTLFNEANGLTF